MSKYRDYQEEIELDVHSCIENMGCQPILFIGSGISRRYFNAPDWENLLKQMSVLCPKINMPFAYYKQTKENLIDIGTEFSNDFLKWAWEDQTQFPPNLFVASSPKDIYFKYKIAEFIDSITPKNINDIDISFKNEIKALQEIRPHSIITTNYDKLLEIIFPDYTPIIGQKVLRTEYNNIGEIFKIHGCSSDYESIVINRSDYSEFQKKKKYLSAKLLTYFAEHPLLFIGYSAEDPNIKAILSDIDELLTNEENELVPNIYFLEWNNKIEDTNLYAREKTILLDTKKSIRIKNIVSVSFEWVFNSFSVEGAIERVNPKLLRALLARTYELVRTDVPRKTIEIDYSSLNRALSGNEDIANIYGITTTNNPKAFNINYPFTLGDIGKQLGFKGWHVPNELINRIYFDTGIDIKASDNIYHVGVRTSSKTISRKYSEDLVSLLEKVLKGEDYEVKI